MSYYVHLGDIKGIYAKLGSTEVYLAITGEFSRYVKPIMYLPISKTYVEDWGPDPVFDVKDYNCLEDLPDGCMEVVLGTKNKMAIVRFLELQYIEKRISDGSLKREDAYPLPDNCWNYIGHVRNRELRKCPCLVEGLR
jgi:hypothetical protein